MVKKAFSLIELIFTIIVLSVAFLALPQLFESSSIQVEEIAKDEATFYGIKTLQDVYRYYWDDRTVKKGTFHILDVSSYGDSELTRNPADPIHRIGTTAFGADAGQRKFYIANTPTTFPLGAEAGEATVDDIDDFNNYTVTQTSSIVDIRTTIRVFYINDNANYTQSTINFSIAPSASPGSTNIKLIEVDVKDNNNNPLLVYRTIACNIGARKIVTKDLQ